MSSINYEVQNNSGHYVKHGFNYQACKQFYMKYAKMKSKEFQKCLLNPREVGVIGHGCSHILRMKQNQVEMMYSLEDYGIVHLLFHCLEFGEDWTKNHSKEIHTLFKDKIKLV